jgi:hypothetical protein
VDFLYLHPSTPYPQILTQLKVSPPLPHLSYCATMLLPLHTCTLCSMTFKEEDSMTFLNKKAEP